jgi:hypothetical protein
MSVTVIDLVEIHAPWLATPVSLPTRTSSTGKKFIKLSKGCPRTTRLLTGKGVGASRLLCSTTTLDNIVKLRNAALSGAGKRKAEEDLEIDAFPQVRVKKEIAPEEITLRMPALPTHEAIDLIVQPENMRPSVWVHVDSRTITYLRRSIEHELKEGDE